MPPKDRDKGAGMIREALRWAWSELNWFRIHLLAYTFIPFIFSGFFIAANPSSSSGLFVTEYLDALFMCFSAMTVSGLSTISVSQTTRAQQAFLFILMLIGDISVVNLITIFGRQTWFRSECRPIVTSRKLEELYSKGRTSGNDVEKGHAGDGRAESPGIEGADVSHSDKKGASQNERKQTSAQTQSQPPGNVNGGRDSDDTQQGSDDTNPGSSEAGSTAKPESNPWQDGFRRRHHLRSGQSPAQHDQSRARDPHGSIPHASSGQAAHSGRGGFPSVQVILFNLFRYTSPRVHQRLSAFLRRCETEGLHSSHPFQALEKLAKMPITKKQDRSEEKEAQNASWLPPGVRGVVVGRNSQFFEEELDEDDLELIGVLEYRATKVLVMMLVAHQLFWILVPTAIIAIYFARVDYWSSNFVANGGSQSGDVNTTWFASFQVVSAYSSCGLSLVDTLMVPFQNCYLLIYVLIFAMLAGNEALPLFLRIEVWLLSKVVRKGSELDVSLHFLLTHSRRLFLYLFPAYQSWYLFGVQGVLVLFGLLGFIAYDHGIDYYSTLGSSWLTFSNGLFQSVAVRSGGFAIVGITYLAPALNFLYLMLIFTSNYPLVMCIRSTNVYEERALGLHGEHAPQQSNQQGPQEGELFSKYLKHHLLPQIYFDLWPIAVGTMLICVLERGKLMDPNNFGWIGVFQILFEVASGYATVGLSFGNPFNTSSLSAEFRTISKLIMMLLMLRGRHRGLPLAIDRATMFPVEYRRLSSDERKEVEKERVAGAGQEADEE